MENQTNTVASVGAPDNIVGQLAGLKELTGGNPIIGVVMVAVVLLGSGAGMKFWTNRSKQKHEEAMRKMELEAELAKVKAKSAKGKSKKQDDRQ